MHGAPKARAPSGSQPSLGTGGKAGGALLMDQRENCSPVWKVNKFVLDLFTRERWWLLSLVLALAKDGAAGWFVGALPAPTPQVA